MTWGVQPARTQEEIDNRIELWHDMSTEQYEALGRLAEHGPGMV